MTSRNKLWREKPKYVRCQFPCKESWWHDTYSPQLRATTSPLAHIEETFHSIFWKAGKVTFQTSSSQTHQFLDAEVIHTTTPLPITLWYY
jgi:hypothetical protein